MTSPALIRADHYNSGIYHLVAFCPSHDSQVTVKPVGKPCTFRVDGQYTRRAAGWERWFTSPTSTRPADPSFLGTKNGSEHTKPNRDQALTGAG